MSEEEYKNFDTASEVNYGTDDSKTLSKGRQRETR